MAAGDHLGCQFDPVSYGGWKKSAAGYGHKGEGGHPIQNNAQAANQAGAFMAADERKGISHSDWAPHRPLGRTSQFYGSASAMSPN